MKKAIIISATVFLALAAYSCIWGGHKKYDYPLNTIETIRYFEPVHKWEYILSIPGIAPKDKSRNTFYHVINDNINNIPDELKADVIKIFENYMEKPNLHPHTVTQYLAVIQKLKAD